jgi:hypothetical protein
MIKAETRHLESREYRNTKSRLLNVMPVKVMSCSDADSIRVKYRRLYVAVYIITVNQKRSSAMFS